MADEAGKGSSLDSVLAVWSRRRWLAILAFVLPFSAGVSVVAFLPNLYRSTAAVLVDRQQIPEAFVRSTVTSALESWRRGYTRSARKSSAARDWKI